MSVVKSKKGEGDLALITKSNEMTCYTLHICSNEKNFPKRYRWCLTNKIVDSAVDINRFINAANSVKVERPEDYQLRSALQKRALAETYSLYATIRVANSIFGIEAGRLEHWSRLIYDVQNYLRAWIKSDNQRYSK